MDVLSDLTCLLFLLEILEERRDVLVPLVDRPVGRAVTRQRLQRLYHRRGRPPVVVPRDHARRSRGRILIISNNSHNQLQGGYSLIEQNQSQFELDNTTRHS